MNWLVYNDGHSASADLRWGGKKVLRLYVDCRASRTGPTYIAEVQDGAGNAIVRTEGWKSREHAQSECLGIVRNIVRDFSDYLDIDVR